MGNAHPRQEVLVRQLASGLEAMDLELEQQSRGKLVHFLASLARWNRVYNLSGVRDPEQMIGKHLLDSLSVLPWLAGEQVLDVGTGAGLPGIPLAIARPGLRFTLLDSNARRLRFVRQMQIELGLGNVTVEQCRVEDYHPGFAFDTVIARAFASLANMLASCGHLIGPHGQLLAMKGAIGTQELEGMPNAFLVAAVTHLRVPPFDTRRNLVCVQRNPAGAAQPSPRPEQTGEQKGHK